jgi:hypothetical protein
MRIAKITMLAIVVALVTATSAFAVGKPTTTTGGHSALTASSVTLLGKVTPNGIATTYFFEYGTTTALGTQTGPVAAGSGTSAANASAVLTGLVPNTTYHYRLVATNNAGATAGGQQTFKTLKQPLGLSLLATPNPAPFGGATTVTATLTGTDNAGRTIVLKARPYPYTAAFAPVGNPEITSATGIAQFPILGLMANTQYVASITGTGVSSPVMSLASAVIPHLNQGSRHVHSGLVGFTGSVTPVEDGALYSIEKLDGATWVGIAGSSLHHHSTTTSSFSIHVRVAHSGSYRVFVGTNEGAHTASVSSTVKLTVVPRKVVHHHG